MLGPCPMSVGVPTVSMYIFLLFWGFPTKALHLNSGWKLSAINEIDLNTTGSRAMFGPGPRAGAAVWTDIHGDAWLFGGRSSSGDSNATQLWADLWLYDAQLQTWQRRIPHSQQAGRELAAMCGTTNGTVVIFGGRNDDGLTNSELLVILPSQAQITTNLCSGDCPVSRYDALVWCDGGTMHITGGYDADDCRLTDAWTLDIGTLTWAQAKLPSTSCRWTSEPGCYTNDNTTAPLAQLWQGSNGTLYIMCDEMTTNGSTNMELWVSSSSESWHLEADSGHGLMTWPGLRRHGSTCVDKGGDLWLFGGQSQIGDLRYLNNDVWTYNTVSHTWHKAELPSDAIEPTQRHLSVSFCGAGAMWVYGGSNCYDGAVSECLLGDLWMLNVTQDPKIEHVAAALEDVKGGKAFHLDSFSPTPSNSPTDESILVLQKGTDTFSNATTDPLLQKTPTSKTATGEGLILDSGGLLRSEIPDLHSAAVAEHTPEGLDHGAYGSVIFFGISLSMFAIFGLVMFFRRCVSCPPRDSSLLKEAPPVRYTVIPDDTYSI